MTSGEKLRQYVRRVKPAMLAEKPKQLNVRVSALEREQIKEICEALGISQTEYLCGMHRHVYGQWIKER